MMRAQTTHTPTHTPWWQSASDGDRAGRPSAFTWEELLQCAQGQLFGPNGPVLPAPPMLMFDCIPHIAETPGERGKRGEVMGEWTVQPEQWFFNCHFHQDPVMPGCLGLDALWQLTGFYMGWLGHLGRGRALGAGKVQFSGQVLPSAKLVRYAIQIKRVLARKDMTLCIANGQMSVDGELVYNAQDLRVGLFVDMEMFEHHGVEP